MSEHNVELFNSKSIEETATKFFAMAHSQMLKNLDNNPINISMCINNDTAVSVVEVTEPDGRPIQFFFFHRKEQATYLVKDGEKIFILNDSGYADLHKYHQIMANLIKLAQLS